MIRLSDFFGIACLLFTAFPAFGQQDTLQVTIPEVLIKGDPWNVGEKDFILDKSRDQETLKDLGNFLQTNSTVFIKNYGPGQSSTVTVRGGNSTHNRVEWNGMSIVNPMLSQTDLSLIPVSLLDNAKLFTGNHSAEMGSGAIGGLIQLQSINDTEDLVSFSFQNIQGQNSALSLKSQTTKGKWTLGLNGQYQEGANEYKYRVKYPDLTGKFEHAHTQQVSILPSISYRNDKITLSIDGWFQFADREIPPTLFEGSSEATQKDNQNRITVNFARRYSKSILKLKAGWLDDRIRFTDPKSGIQGDNKAGRTLIGGSYQLELSQRWSFEGKLDYSLEKGKSLNYNSTESIHWLRSAMNLSYYSLKKQLSASLSIRQDWNSNESLPTVAIGNISWTPKGIFSTHFKLGNHYRYPGLDDLYWSPGGNTNLETESGYSGEVGIQLSNQNSSWKYDVRTTYFQSRIENYIQWLPNGSVWSPANIGLVKIQGLEFSVNLEKAFEKWKLGFFHQNSITNTKDVNQGENELVYVPFHKSLSGISYSRSSWSIYSNINTISLFYTSRDNSEFIDQQYWLNLGGNWHSNLGTKGWQFLLSVEAQNITNRPLMMVQSRPLPGFQLLLTLKIQKI